ncbi:ABC transporter permease [Ruminococcaceae bacterium OttesenSCG-928-A11]|nr:ABC transporter permease [Ruminococcaceae bacterium OttesenSCG-928-A11]
MGRFIAIFAISALGAGFYAGLKGTGPDMKATADRYYAAQHLADFTLQSTLGFTDGDVDALAAEAGVGQVMPGYALDLLVEHPEGSEAVHFVSLPEHCGGDDPAWLSRPVVVAGRLPAAADECVVDSASGYAIGDTISLSGENDPDTLDLMAQNAFTVVGRAESPSYIAFQRGNTNIGNGRVSFFAYLTPAAFDQTAYTLISLAAADADGLSAFSEGYAGAADDLEATLEALAPVRAQARYDEIYAEGLAELTDARAELADGRAEADEKLAEAWQEILDAEAEIADGWVKVRENEQKLADAEGELADGQKAYDDGLASLQSGEGQYHSGLAAYQQGLAKYKAALAEYGERKAQVDAIAPGITGLPDATAGALAALEGGDHAGFAELAAVALTGAGGGAGLLGQSEDPAAQQAAGAVNALIGEAAAALGQQPVPDFATAAAKLQQISTYHPAMAGALAATQAALDEGKAALDASARTLADSKAQLDAAKAAIDAGYAALPEAAQKLADGKAEIADGRRQLAEARAELADAERELADGKAEYAAEQADAYAEIAEAEAEIADGQQALDDLEPPEWYIRPRGSNPGYSGFASDAERIDAIAVVIPVFFFLVAALVCLTSMTRMVEEQRGFIGTMKALGYQPFSIAGKYLIYAAFASLSGAVLGVVVGLVVFPMAIWQAYGMMYIMPELSLFNSPVLAVTSAAACVLVTTAATLAACLGELRSVPAQLMRPRPPRAGKRVFLEHIGPLWRRMNFMQKVTVRNLFRYKKRFFMTVIGVSGCTALLLTGFGLGDSISGIVPRQYGGIELYTVQAALTEPSDSTAATALNETWPQYGQALYTMEALVDAHSDGGSSAGMTVYLFVPEKPEDLTRFISLHDRKTQAPLAFPADGGVVITEKLADRLKVAAGDRFEVARAGEKPVALTVAGVTENYVYNYIYMPPAQHAQLFGEAPEYTGLLMNLNPDAPAPEAVVSALLEAKPVAGAVDIGAMTDQLNDMFESLNAVVWVVIAAAALLAFVVLYNLTNINITERTREIATLKVLGFRPGEVSAYVYRENLVLTLIGTAFGLVLGVFLHDFVTVTAEVDEVMFRRTIEPLSYLYSVVFTILCGVVVNLVMQRRLNRIDMVESLKSIE